MKNPKLLLGVSITILFTMWILTAFTTKKVSSTQIPNCYTSIRTCPPSSVLLSINVTDCSLATSQLNKGIFTVSSPILNECFIGTDVFCCATVKLGSSCTLVTPNGLPTGQYVIDQVTCTIRPE